MKKIFNSDWLTEGGGLERGISHSKRREREEGLKTKEKQGESSKKRARSS